MVISASGLFLPNANVGALSVRPELAGSAAVRTGALQMAFSALATVVPGATLAGPETRLIALTVDCSVLSAASLLLLRLGVRA